MKRLFLVLILMLSYSVHAEDAEPVMLFDQQAAKQLIQSGYAELNLQVNDISVTLDDGESQHHYKVTSVQDFANQIRKQSPAQTIPGYPDLVYGWNYMKDQHGMVYDVVPELQRFMQFEKSDGKCFANPQDCPVSVTGYSLEPLSVVGDLVSYLSRGEFTARYAMHPVGWTVMRVINRKSHQAVRLTDLIDESELVKALKAALPLVFTEVDEDLALKWKSESALHDKIVTLKPLEEYIMQNYERSCVFPWNSLDHAGFTISGYNELTNQVQLIVGMSAIANMCREFMLPIQITAMPNSNFKSELLTVSKDKKGRFMDFKNVSE